MNLGRGPRVLFRATAGPGRGFGHLIRCRVLARSMRVAPWISLRASAATVALARKMGWKIWTGGPATLGELTPSLLIIDDPSPRATRPWIVSARRRRVLVASLHDGHLGDRNTDFTIDGSLMAASGARSASLSGPSFAIVDPAVARLRSRRLQRRRDVVLVTLGGGRHVRRLGVDVAKAIRSAAPSSRVDVVAGFGSVPRRRLPAGCRWVQAPRGLARLLATASVTVVAGGITLYEACALGTPVVTLPVVRAQQPAVRAFARAGAVLDASGRTPHRATSRAAVLVASLLAEPHRAARLGARGRTLVDGLGAARVALHLHHFIDRAGKDPLRHVA